MIPVTLIVTTRNEAPNIERCLGSAHGFIDQIFVIDSDSDDDTVAISRQYAEVVSLPYDHSKIIPWIYQWALDNLSIQNDWVMILEADQMLTSPLKEELQRVFSGRDIAETGFYVRQDDILFYLQKHLRYADVFAREELKRHEEGLNWKLEPRLLGTPDQRVLWLKQIFFGLPLYIRPFLYFFYRYVILLGFLDGKQGAIFHFLQAFWFRLVWDIRLEELKAQGCRKGAGEQGQCVSESEVHPSATSLGGGS